MAEARWCACARAGLRLPAPRGSRVTFGPGSLVPQHLPPPPYAPRRGAPWDSGGLTG